MASRAALVAGCKGYFRVDLRENQGHLFVMDINPNPALTRDSGMARQYMQKGKTYEQLVMKILQLAILNYKKRDDHENN
jgi:D-alanine-D-alanine ligase